MLEDPNKIMAIASAAPGLQTDANEPIVLWALMADGKTIVPLVQRARDEAPTLSRNHPAAKIKPAPR